LRQFDTGSISAQAVAAVSGYLTAFFDRYLRGGFAEGLCDRSARSHACDSVGSLVSARRGLRW